MSPSAATAQALIAQARSRLAKFKLPRRVAFGAVGRTETGKLHKAALRARVDDFAVFDMGKVQLEAAA